MFRPFRPKINKQKGLKMDWFVEYWNCLGNAAQCLLLVAGGVWVFFCFCIAGNAIFNESTPPPWWAWPTNLVVVGLLLYWIGLALYQIVTCLF